MEDAELLGHINALINQADAYCEWLKSKDKTSMSQSNIAKHGSWIIQRYHTLKANADQLGLSPLIGQINAAMEKAADSCSIVRLMQ